MENTKGRSEDKTCFRAEILQAEKEKNIEQNQKRLTIDQQ